MTDENKTGDEVNEKVETGQPHEVAHEGDDRPVVVENADNVEVNNGGSESETADEDSDDK